MKLLVLSILLLTSSAYAGCISCHAEDFNPAKEVIAEAKKYTYVREKTNRNDAPEIDLWLKNCGLGKGYPYCQAFFNSMYKNVYERHNRKSPFPMYAGVARTAEYCIKNPMKFKVITTQKMVWGIDSPQQGDLASWKHGKAQFTGFGYQGHAEIVDYSKFKDVYTIGANTKAGEGGDQSGTVKGDMKYGHEGVYARKRNININSTFPIVYFIRSR